MPPNDPKKVFFVNPKNDFIVFFLQKKLKNGICVSVVRFFFKEIKEMNVESMTPRISVQYLKNVTIVSFTDEKILEEQDIRELSKSIMSVVSEADGIKLILDFSSVQFLSSTVLGLLIRLSKKVYEGDGQLVLCSINPKILQVFKITRLDKVFNIYPDQDSAFASLD
jgi:anti-sigma B factor antagonist